LIKQGAKLVSCADEILEEFNLNIPVNSKIEEIKEAKPAFNACLFGNESVLYNLILDEPVLLDDIVEKSGFGIPEISGILLKLQMRRLIRQIPGKQFVRTAT